MKISNPQNAPYDSWGCFPLTMKCRDGSGLVITSKRAADYLLNRKKGHSLYLPVKDKYIDDDLTYRIHCVSAGSRLIVCVKEARK